MFKPTLLAAFVAACSSLPVIAETVLPRQIVTATRLPQAISQTLASVHVIDRQTLDRYQGQDLGDILRFNTNGIEIIRSGGLGQQTSLFTRGTNSNHTLVLIDGVRINSATSSQASIQSLALNDVERIEVVKGPMSVLYGSDAIGGVINIITRTPDKTATRLALSAGSDNQLNVDAGQTFRNGDISGRLDLGQTRTNGYAFVEGLAMDRGYQNRNGSTMLRYDAGSVVFDLQARHNEGTTEYVNTWNLAPLDQDFLNEVFALGAAADIADHWNSRLRLSLMRDEIDQNQNNSQAHTERQQADWQNTVGWADGQTLLAGLTVEKVDTVYNQTYQEQLDNSAVFLQQQSQWGAFSLQAGARRDRHDTFGDHDTGNLATGYQLTPQVRVYLNAGSAFRAPDFNNLYGFGGNPALKPEQSASVELGSHIEAGPVTTHLALFKTKVEDLIVFNQTFTQLINLNEAQLEGLEIGSSWQQSGWLLGVQGNYIKAIDGTTQTKLDRRPRRSLTVQTGFRQDNWDLTLETLAKSRTQDFGGNLPGYATVNLNSSWKLMPQLTLRASLENLLDKTYGTAHFGTNVRYLSKPRSASLSANVTF